MYPAPVSAHVKLSHRPGIPASEAAHPTGGKFIKRSHGCIVHAGNSIKLAVKKTSCFYLRILADFFALILVNLVKIFL